MKVYVVLNNDPSVTDLFVAFTGHPTSCESLDGDGGHTDYMVDLSHTVPSPIPLDHQ